MVNLQLKCGGRSTEISFAADNQVLSKSCQCLSMLVQNYAGNMLCELKLEINRLGMSSIVDEVTIYERYFMTFEFHCCAQHMSVIKLCTRIFRFEMLD
jgi:hypothetical protein